MESEIVIPNDLESIHEGKVSKLALTSLKPNRSIIYYDSLDCSSCRISHLGETIPYMKWLIVWAFLSLRYFLHVQMKLKK